MPIQTFNFLGAPITKSHIYQPDYSAIANFLPNALKAYYQPEELKQDLLQKQQNVLQTKENIRDKMLRNALLQEFGRPREQADLARTLAEAQILQQYGPQLKGAELAGMLLKNKLMGQYEPREREADIAYKRALTERAEYEMPDIQTSMGINNELVKSGIPGEVIGDPLRSYSKGERQFLMKEMLSNQKKYESQERAYDTTVELEKIVREHPNLWKSYSLFLNSDDPKDPSLLALAKSQVVSEKDKTAIDKFSKLSSDLILQAGESMGGSRAFTDYTKRMVSQTKPNVRNTAAANQYLIDRYKDLFSSGKTGSKAFREGIKHRTFISDNPNAFKQASEFTERSGYGSGESSEGYLEDLYKAAQ